MQKSKKVVYVFCINTVVFLLCLIALLTTTPVRGKTDQRAVYKVAIDREYAPYEFMDRDGTIRGFTPDLLEEIGKSTGVTFKLIPMDWPDAVTGLGEGRIDLINMIRTRKRLDLYEFSEPHSIIKQAIFRHVSVHNIKDLESLAGHRVALQRNDIYLEMLANRTDFQKFQVNGKAEGFLLLNAGRVDAFLSADQAGLMLIQEYDLTNVVPVAVGLFPQDFCFAARRGNRKLISILNIGLKRLKESGRYDVIFKKWLALDVSQQNWLMQHRYEVALFTGTLAAILAGFVIWNVMLRRTVELRTRDLLESRNFLAEAQRIAHIGSWSWDIKQDSLQWSDETFRIFGIDREKFAANFDAFIQTVHPDDRRRVQDSIQQAVLEGSPDWTIDYRIIHPDGGINFLHEEARSVFAPDGEVLKRFGTVQDITQRIQTEEELACHREHLEELVRERTAELESAKNKAQQYLDIAGVLLLAIDIDRRVTMINQRGCELLGGSPQDIIGKDWFKTFIPQDILEDVTRDFNLLISGEVEPVEYFENPIITLNGDVRLIAWHNALLRDDTGNIVGTLSSGEDITETKEAEIQIKILNQNLQERALALETANRELESFAYSVSHDLRAPLRHIDGFISLLRKRISETLDETGWHYMTIVSDASRRMGMLIDGLLSYSRMGRFEPNRHSVRLDSLVRDVIRELEPETRGRTVQWQIADLPVVTGDHTMLRMVLVNLISNALKFTRIRERAEIEIGSEPFQGHEIVIFVRDNGVGFDMSFVDKLFNVFQRLHREKEFEGTGIGLANVRQIIHRHGGRTWAEGIPDQGATFYFTLPQQPI